MEPDIKPAKQRRGFAAMSAEKHRALAAKGGASVPREKRSFSKDKDLAADAGRKGGLARSPLGPGRASLAR